MKSFDFKRASEYLATEHALAYSPEILQTYAEDRKRSRCAWGPTPNADGRYSPQALDGFADGIKRARLKQVAP